MADNSLVYIVDDDQAIRDSLSLLMRSVGLGSRTFSSAADFLKAYDPANLSCLVADVRMPEISGLELQEELLVRHIEIPIIFITGYGDVPMAVEAMKAGAVDFLQKPFRDQQLLDCINAALQKDRDLRALRQEIVEIRKRLETLTPRETEVLDKVVEGCANKVIAMDLSVSQRTIELHRARVMHKMQVRSLAELVRAVEKVR